MKTLISFVIVIFGGLSAQADQIYVQESELSEGICVAKQDPNLDSFCSEHLEDSVCQAEPVCRWIKAETLKGLFQIYVEEPTVIE